MTQQVPDRTVFERALPREEMDDITRALFDAALGVQEHAHAPYSNYHVGCSVLTSSGQIYVGANRMRIPTGSVAEATALAVMASHGERQAQVASRCVILRALQRRGGCRQKIREFATSETIIHACSRNGLWATYTMDGLLPDSFGPEHLSTA